MKNWNKSESNVSVSDKKETEDHIAVMSKAMDELCEMLAKNSDEFEREKFFIQFGKYINNNKNRLLYTIVTNRIFSTNEIVGTFQTNLEKVIIYAYEIAPGGKSKQNEHEKIQRALMKLWDHINLAIRQYELFNKSDQQYEKIAEAKIKDVEIHLTKEMNMQLISLIGIFTALSFIVFGGISSLDNIFQGVQDIPITKLMVVGTIWCFCIMNLVYIFMFFIAKLTKLELKSTQDVNANIVQKYPLIWWCNWLLLSLLAISCWAYYVKCEGFSAEAFLFLEENSIAYFVFGTIAVLAIIVTGAMKLYQVSKKTERKE